MEYIDSWDWLNYRCTVMIIGACRQRMLENRCLWVDRVPKRPDVFLLVRRLRVCSFDWVTTKVQENQKQCFGWEARQEGFFKLSSLFGLSIFIWVLEITLLFDIYADLVDSSRSVLAPIPLINIELTLRGFPSFSRSTCWRRDRGGFSGDNTNDADGGTVFPTAEDVIQLWNLISRFLQQFWTQWGNTGSTQAGTPYHGILLYD